MDVFTSAVLTRVINGINMQAPSAFLLSRWFPVVETSFSEDIMFDVVDGRPRLAPFVLPTVEGQIVRELGHRTQSFRPAYVKPKTPFEQGKSYRRRPGQPLVLPTDPGLLIDLAISDMLSDHRQMIVRRKEWMAAQVARTGAVTVSGEKYPTVVVDFGRNAALNVTLAGAARWNDSAPDPLGNLETWAGLVRTYSGTNPIDVVMAEDAWTSLRKNAEVKAFLDNPGRSARTVLDIAPDARVLGATFKGTLGDFNLWIYNETFEDEAGVLQKYIPDGELVMGGPGIEGAQHHGAIRDERAGFQPFEMFSKSWIEEDPPVRWILTQSAPLVVPYRVNGVLRAKVQ